MNDYKGYILVNFDIPEWISLQKQLIDKNDIFLESEYLDPYDSDYGLSRTPHVTALYGLNIKTNWQTIEPYLIPNEYIVAKFTKMSLFENQQFDVLKFDVESKTINNLNKILVDNLNYKNDYPKFKLHLTIAYLKKGTGKKYLTNQGKPFTLTSNSYTFSNGLQKETKIYKK